MYGRPSKWSIQTTEAVNVANTPNTSSKGIVPRTTETPGARIYCNGGPNFQPLSWKKIIRRQQATASPIVREHHPHLVRVEMHLHEHVLSALQQPRPLQWSSFEHSSNNERKTRKDVGRRANGRFQRSHHCRGRILVNTYTYMASDVDTMTRARGVASWRSTGNVWRSVVMSVPQINILYPEHTVYQFQTGVSPESS